MIKLDPQFQTTIQTLSGDTVTSSVVTDTLFVSQVSLDLQAGTISAHILRGSLNPGFFENAPSVDIVVNVDGSFHATNGDWSGTLSGIGTLVAQLKATFDQFVTSSGLVSGTLV